MYKIIQPFINLANANLLALSRFVWTPEAGAADQANELWRETMENQARFVREYAQDLLGLLAQSRLLTTGHLETLTERTEQVATQLAHTTVRAVAIATHARRDKRDRRVFPLPLPNGQREVADRRRRVPLASHQASI